MTKKASKPKASGTFNALVNAGPNLYRHPNGTYYGAKKVRGQRIVHCLETSDRKLADRKLPDWLRTVVATDADAASLTLGGLLARYRRLNPKHEKNTALKLFEDTFQKGMEIKVGKVKPSDLAEWFTKTLAGVKNNTFNQYRGYLIRVFKLAVIDRVVAEPIFSEELIPKKKRNDTVRNAPDAGRFAQILARMRKAAEFNHPNSQAADFTEFMGVVGVGQAEAGTIEMEDITPTELRFTRMKTGKPFSIPIFHKTRELLERLIAKRGSHPGRLFHIREADHAFRNAIIALTKADPEFEHYSPRNLRSMKIIEWLESGVDVKQIAEWQGHGDGGKLILERYSAVIRTKVSEEAYRQEQIARAEGRIVRFQPAA